MSFKMNIFKVVFLSVIITSFAEARSFKCSSKQTQHEVLYLKFDSKDNLTDIAEIAQTPFAGADIQDKFENVAGKVIKDIQQTQSVLFTDHYTERMTLKINLVEKLAFIEVFDTDDWQVTRIEELMCDYEGYYERN